MKIKSLIIFYLAISIINGFSKGYAANLNKSFDLGIETISKLCQSQIAKSIRTEFDEFNDLKKRFQDDDFFLFTDGDKYRSVYSEKFIVLEFERNPFGGFWVVIVIGPKKPRYFSIWVYNIGGEEEEWDVRLIDEIFFDSERLSQLEEIKSPKYARFWL